MTDPIVTAARVRMDGRDLILLTLLIPADAGEMLRVRPVHQADSETASPAPETFMGMHI